VTFAAVGSSIQEFNTSSFSLTPGGVGNLILLEINNKSNNTVTCNGVSSSNVTWAQMGTSHAGATQLTAVIFAGKVTSTSAATVTLTWNGTTPGSYQADGQEFSSTQGAWSLDTQGNLDGSGTNTWPSLTPAGSGELYFGYAYNSVGASAGSTSGYTYVVDAHANGMAYNPACSGSAQAPVWGDSTQIFGIMILVEETGTPHTSTPSLTVTPAFAVKKAEAHVQSATVTPAFSLVKAEAHKQSMTVTPAFSVTDIKNFGKGGTPDRHHRRSWNPR
jgi:hypothetical protein